MQTATEVTAEVWSQSEAIFKPRNEVFCFCAEFMAEGYRLYIATDIFILLAWSN